MTWWADVNARARGLSGHLLDRAAWRSLRAAPDLPGLNREIQRFGYPLEPGADARAAERIVERVRRQRQVLLLRWLGGRARHVRFLIEAEDRRTIRALLRGAAAGLPAGERLAVVPPGCGVGDALVAAATRAATADACLEWLADQGQPLAARTRQERAVLGGTWPGLPSLLALDLALARAWAARAVEGAKHGGAELRRPIAFFIDLENAWSALGLRTGDALPAEAVFLEGGRRLPRGVFLEVVDASSAAEARALIGHAFPGRLGELFADTEVLATRLERAALEIAARRQEGELRRAPLGPAPLLTYLLRLRVEAVDLRAALWARALGAPPDLLEVVA